MTIETRIFGHDVTLTPSTEQYGRVHSYFTFTGESAASLHQEMMTRDLPVSELEEDGSFTIQRSDLKPSGATDLTEDEEYLCSLLESVVAQTHYYRRRFKVSETNENSASTHFMGNHCMVFFNRSRHRLLISDRISPSKDTTSNLPDTSSFATEYLKEFLESFGVNVREISINQKPAIEVSCADLNKLHTTLKNARNGDASQSANGCIEQSPVYVKSFLEFYEDINTLLPSREIAA